MGWRQWTRSAVLVLAALTGSGAQALDLQAHRGGRGLWPENTLAAFEGALRLGVTTLELDVGLTADGVLVVAHDQRLNPLLARGPDGQWLEQPGPPLASLTLAQVQAYDVGRIRPGTPYAQAFAEQQPADGQRMPTLAQVFDLARRLGAGSVRFDIETKIDPGWSDARAEAITTALLSAIRSAGVQDRATVQSFDWRTLRIAQRLAPGLPTACLSAQSPGYDTVQAGKPEPSPWLAGLRHADHGSVPRLAKAAGCTVWSAAFQGLTPESVREAHALGLQVLAWTVNTPADMERLLDWGVDGLITDRPDLARTVMQRRGLPLPAPAAPR